MDPFLRKKTGWLRSEAKITEIKYDKPLYSLLYPFV